MLNGNAYTCTSEFLLRDCVDKLVEDRFAQLKHAGFMGHGLALLTTHFAL